MRIFGRNLLLKDLLSRTVSTTVTITNVFLHFENALSVIKHYLKRTSPEEKFIKLKKGFKILFSSHRHDLITTLIIFARKDYGSIKKDSVVIDIGANIGIFSLFAAYSGAKIVYAIEPNSESFDVLSKNIYINQLESIIRPTKAAVSNTDGEKVLIPIGSSPYNAVLENSNGEINEVKKSAYEAIETLTVESIIKQNNIELVDLLKIDCEGHEFKIVPALSGAILKRIKEIKLEYQGGDVAIIMDHLAKNAFHIVKHEKDERFDGGMLWVSK